MRHSSFLMASCDLDSKTRRKGSTMKQTGKTRPTNSGEKPKPASNRIVNHHPRFPQYPRSVGKDDVDVTFGVNIPVPPSNPISGRSNSIATQKPRVVTGSVQVK